METFSTLLSLWEGNPLVTSGFPSEKPVLQSFDVFFDLHLNKQLGKIYLHLAFLNSQKEQGSCPWEMHLQIT